MINTWLSPQRPMKEKQRMLETYNMSGRVKFEKEMVII